VNFTAALTFGEESVAALAIAGLVWFAFVACSNLITLGNATFSLRAHDSVDTVSLSALWNPREFWRFLATSLLFGLSVAAGLILFIVPGIIFFAMFGFSLYLVIDRGVGPVEAMRESRRITNGNRLNIVGLTMLVILVNILGFLAAFVGLLVSMPVTGLAMVHAYRTLAANDARPLGDPAAPAAA
jgi:uncharacterized membrane protein